MTQAGSDLKGLAQAIHERVAVEMEDQGVDARTALGRMWVQHLQDQGVVGEVFWPRLDVGGSKGFLLDGCAVRTGDTGAQSRRIHLFGVIENGTAVGQNGVEFAGTVRRTEVEAVLRRLEHFAVLMRNGVRLEQEDEDADVRRIATELRAAFQVPELELEFVVLTDGRVATSDFARSAEFGAVQRVLDIAWLSRNVKDDGAYVVDFNAIGGLGCLVSERDVRGEPRILLTTIRGDVLARVYATHRERLMERNVRSYLQQRNKVNKDIARTIREEPERFLCFNNGISGTAQSVDFDEQGRLIALTGLQIVNGGQTTATIHSFLSKPSMAQNLTRVQVQAKITIVDDTELSQLVPLISRSSNSQTAIKSSDLQANMDWEIEMERASRSLEIMGPDGTATYWYYERARGSHATMLAMEPNAAARARKETRWPTSQVLTKADAALLLASWDGSPQLASKGPEAGFVAISKAKKGIESGLDRLPEGAVERQQALQQASEATFRKIVALAMLRREVQRLVAEHTTKMKPPLVNYTMAWLGDRQSKLFDPDVVCRTGRLNNRLLEMAREVVPLVNQVLQHRRPVTVAHESEWPKKPACWSMVQEIVLGQTPASQPDTPGAQGRLVLQIRETTPASPVERLALVPMQDWYAARRWVAYLTNPSLRKDLRAEVEPLVKGMESGKGKDAEFARKAIEVYERLLEKGFRPSRRTG